MARTGLRILLASGVVAVLGMGACAVLLPERYAVSGPLLNSMLGWGIEPPDDASVEAGLTVPPEFAVSVYAVVPRARALRPTPAGDLLVSVPRDGKVELLERDADGDGRPDGIRTLLEGLDRPHGLDLHDGWLYVAEGSAVRRVRFDAATGTTEGALETVVSGLPAGGNHWTRTVRIGPDGWMYVTVGSSCNACVEEDPRRAAMLRFRPDGSEPSLYAVGLRNSVGFDWQPGTGALYATDNGRDLLGDDTPPCELNRIEPGGDYGWPVAYGDRVPDPDLGAGHEDRVRASTPPAFAFRAHNAPLGIVFLRSPAQPERLRGDALVALHGSWNRTRKDGYKVVSLHWDADGSIHASDFLTGFLRDDRVSGRPVDVAEAADGTIFVSDDYAGVVYRIAPRERAARPGAAALSAALPTAPLAGLPEDEIAAARTRGEALFARFECAGCHDPAHAAAGVVPVPLVRLGARYDLAAMQAMLAAPTPPMPLFPLDEAERRDLAIYLLAERG